MLSTNQETLKNLRLLACLNEGQYLPLIPRGILSAVLIVVLLIILAQLSVEKPGNQIY